MTKFFIGDKVKVIDNGTSYTVYQTWADAYGLKNYTNKDFYCPNNGMVATVIAVGSHLRYNAILTGIRTESGQEYILGEWGLELVSRANLKDMLTNGRRVKLRNGDMFVVFNNTLVAFDNYRGLKWSSDDIQKSYDVNLMNVWSSECDVLAIYEKPSCVIDYFVFSKYTDLIWQREEKTAKQLQLEALQKQAQDVADAIKKLQDEE